MLSQTSRSDDASLHLAIGQIAYDRGELESGRSGFVKATASAETGNPAGSLRSKKCAA